MKKETLIFTFNLFLTFALTVSCLKISTLAADKVTSVNETIVSVFSPLSVAEKVVETFSNTNSENSDNNTNTTSDSDDSSAQGTTKKDSDLYSDITEVPDDIAQLMNEASKTIESEEVIGKTSEENYLGGGTLVSFQQVEIQCKIPTSFYELDIEKLLEQKAELTIKDKSEPTILIYHTHTTESYTLLDVGYYTDSLELRSKDTSKNMVRVGDDLTEYLEKMGYNVIHDTTIYDTDYNSAYDKSREAVLANLEKYPSIEITIDVHRDDITYKDKTKVKPTVTINGKKAARMMIISGAEYGSVTNFPNWESNLKFSVAVQNKVNSMYEGLMRPIMFSQRRYNMDLTRNSFLLEIGTDANTLDEACYSARLFATGLGELLEEYIEE